MKKHDNPIGNTAISVIIILFLYAVIHFAIGKLFPQPGNLFTATLWLTAATILLVGFYQKTAEKISFFHGFIDSQAVRNFFTGGFVATAIACTGTMILFFNGNIFWQDILFDAGILKYVILMLAVAIAEEFLFRGFVLRNLLKKLSPFNALIISSLLFSLFHFFNPDASWIAIVNIALGGMLMGSLYIKSKT